MRDIVNNIKVTPAWAGATISTATDTVSTTVVDGQGFESIAMAVHSGTYTDGAYVLKIMECDNADGTTGATEVGSYIVQNSFGAASSNTVKKVGAKLNKRYCTLKITSTGTTTGCVFKSGVAILGNARNSPVA
jgi:hypothetical protein